MIPAKPQQSGPRVIGPSKMESFLANVLFYGTMIGSCVMLILGFMALVG